ncbi:hypothetical protein P5673_021566 [Acropora cervicornis]|uniref:Uncharacterized protein n=1 Tax=Acropora cervicornis TaxID=6130 RepID=A0AAD9Q7T8_ACRCE|nr:hypothetical protein P5673_021566 [Acropora cervicornis]
MSDLISRFGEVASQDFFEAGNGKKNQVTLDFPEEREEENGVTGNRGCDADEGSFGFSSSWDAAIPNTNGDLLLMVLSPNPRFDDISPAFPNPLKAKDSCLKKNRTFPKDPYILSETKGGQETIGNPGPRVLSLFLSRSREDPGDEK